jgi:hypothetical protein
LSELYKTKMTEAPPTSSGPVEPAAGGRASLTALGAAIAAGCVFIACFAVPLGMNSNIWPIAGVFWSVFTVPVAAGTGALTGWLLRRLPPAMAIPALVFTGVALAIAAGIIIANNR